MFSASEAASSPFEPRRGPMAPSSTSKATIAAPAVASAPTTSPGQAVSPSSASEAAKAIAPLALSSAITGTRAASRPRAKTVSTTSASSVTRNQVAVTKPKSVPSGSKPASRVAIIEAKRAASAPPIPIASARPSPWQMARKRSTARQAMGSRLRVTSPPLR